MVKIKKSRMSSVAVKVKSIRLRHFFKFRNAFCIISLIDE